MVYSGLKLALPKLYITNSNFHLLKTLSKSFKLHLNTINLINKRMYKLNSHLYIFFNFLIVNFYYLPITHSSLLASFTVI